MLGQQLGKDSWAWNFCTGQLERAAREDRQEWDRQDRKKRTGQPKQLEHDNWDERTVAGQR
jgi:hypothetical protein